MHYLAKVKFEFTDENEKKKTKTRKYIVEAVSVGDAEMIVHENLKDMAVIGFTVTTIGEFEIEEYLTKETAKNRKYGQS
jgi:hypothetical protein